MVSLRQVNELCYFVFMDCIYGKIPMKKLVSAKKKFGLKPLTVACLMMASASASANTFHANNVSNNWYWYNGDWWWIPGDSVYIPDDGSNTGGNNNGGNTGGNNSGNNNPSNAGYVAPVSNVGMPNYARVVDRNLAASQPRGSHGTIAGYSAMDDVNHASLTQGLYGTDQAGYANRLTNLKNTIDTRQMRVGVIDSGIDRNNRDMIGANVHNTQVRCNIKNANNCYMPNDDSGIVEVSSTFASGSHGAQMAAIVAGNNGMTNARIYGSDSVDRASNGGNQFLMARKLNDNHGVKIFNNSWGSDNSDRWYTDALNANYNRNTGEVTYKRTGITHADITLPVLHDMILNRDALFLKATGNEAQNDAHDENLAPLINSDFKKGFITVSAPREDFAAANLCGRTADWCLAATSSSTNYDNNGSLSTYQGTSPATARATGTAVLVKAAYPWMKNENIAQTLLGTAKDFNDIARTSPTYRGLVRVSRLPAGYRGQYFTDGQGGMYIQGDKSWDNRRVIKNHNGKNITWESGWGLLDPESAAKGYGGFYWDNVVLDTAGTPVSVFYNDLKGERGFTKRGAGKLVFTGNNSYRGDSIIEGGTLEVNGNNGQSTIRINGGELTGYGSVGSVVQQGGQLNNEGNLTINGSLTTNQNSEFKAKFGNMLNVNGRATLGGTISLTGEARDGIISQNGNRSTVLRARDGISGQYANQRSINPLFEITKVDYTPTADANGNTRGGTNTDVQVTARRLNAGNVVRSVSMMDSGSRVASNLDKVLVSLDEKQANTALSSDEKAFASQVFSGFENMVTATDGDDKLVLSVANTNRELYKLDPSVYANTASNAVEVSATNAVDFAKKMGDVEAKTFWGGATHQEYDYALDHATSDRKTNGFNVGVGTKLDNGVSVGAQIETGKSELVDSVYGISNKTETKMTGLTVGASKSITETVDVTGWVQGANTATKVSRNGDKKSGDFDGRVLGAGIQVGGKLKVGEQIDVKPYAFVGHQNYKSDDKYDDGINTINKLSAKQTQIGAGVDVATMVTPNWEVYGGVQVANAVKKDVKLNTSYTGTSTDVEFEGWDTGKNQVKATIGTNYNITPNAKVGLNYSHTNGKHDDVSTVGASFTMKF